MKKTTVYFRGMNTDLEPRLMSKGKYRDATNVRIGGAKGTLGALENVQGLKELCCDNLPEGKNTSIGSYGSDETTSVFVFFHNSEGKHSIVRYYPLDETCCVLLVCEDLNFKLDHYISHIEFIDKTYLIWSDGKVNLNQKKQGGENVTTVTGQEIRSLNVCLYENKTGPFCYNFWIEKYTEEQDWSSVRSTLIIGEREVTLRGNVYEAIANLNDDSIKVEDCDGCLKIESTEKLEVRSGIPNILQPTNFCEGCNIPLIQYPPLCSPKVKLSKEEGKQGRSYDSKKKKAVIAVELNKKYQIKRVYVKSIDDYSAKSLTPIFEKHISNTAQIVTDKWREYQPLKGKYNIEQKLSNQGKKIKRIAHRINATEILAKSYTNSC